MALALASVMKPRSAGLLSMRTGWFASTESCWLMVRARKSGPPPAG
jgi:hypothetical protein